MTDTPLTPKHKRIAILGSTGSIGTQALDVVRMHPSNFTIEVLMANSHWKLLVSQAKEFKPRTVVIGDASLYSAVNEELACLGIQVYAGEESVWQILDSGSIDLVLLAIVGAAGLRPALAALKAGIDLALANKESLVAGGELVMKAAAQGRAMILPVDSEHSAIFQCLLGESPDSVSKIILTASGGPFLGKDLAFLQRVTPAQAMKHPNWSMGCKISIDSATMMNKGLEVIEARWLFNLKPEAIDVLIHPQSIVHSLVEFIDGSMKAQLGTADMRIPIMYALGWPDRIDSPYKRLDLCQFAGLTFQIPDRKLFHNLALAYEALERGGNVPCVMNAANEMAVNAFLRKEISFLQIPEVIEQVMESMVYSSSPGLEEVLHSDKEARIFAGEMIKKKRL